MKHLPRTALATRSVPDGASPAAIATLVLGLGLLLLALLLATARPDSLAPPVRSTLPVSSSA